MKQVFSIITIFPELFSNFLSLGVISKGIKTKEIRVEFYNPRGFSTDKNNRVDDKPYGGGSGMIMKYEPIKNSLLAAKKNNPLLDETVIYLTPKGKLLTQSDCADLKLKEHCILICGRYTGIDQRVIDKFVDLELSIGDYILTGGEIPAMVLMDSIIRLHQGILGNDKSLKEESFNLKGCLLEYPQYTKPSVIDNMSVPEVLLTGNHEKIKQWKEDKALFLTSDKRPDLIDKKD